VLTRRQEREARSRHWFTSDEIEMYRINLDPDRTRDFLSFEAWSRVVRRPLGENRWRDVLDNKWTFGKVFRDLGLPVPRDYGLLEPISGSFEDGTTFRSLDDLAAWLRVEAVSSFVLKPVLGWASKGVIVVDEVERGPDGTLLRLADGRVVTVEGLRPLMMEGFRGVPGYILQERLWLHRWVSDLSGGGPAGFRIVTLRTKAGACEPVCAVMRVGFPDQMSETFATGSLVMPVDLATGELGPGLTSKDLGATRYEHHPASGRALEGAVVPDWSAIVQLALRAAERQPGLACVCWDVLLTPGGPVLLEGNVGFQIQTFQIHGRGFLADGTAQRWAELGSDLPDGSRAWVRRNTPGLAKRVVRAASRASRRVRRLPSR